MKKYYKAIGLENPYIGVELYNSKAVKSMTGLVLNKAEFEDYVKSRNCYSFEIVEFEAF